MKARRPRRGRPDLRAQDWQSSLFDRRRRRAPPAVAAKRARVLTRARVFALTPRLPDAREPSQLRAVSFGVNECEPHGQRQPVPSLAVNLPVQTLDATLLAPLERERRHVRPI